MIDCRELHGIAVGIGEIDAVAFTARIQIVRVQRFHDLVDVVILNRVAVVVHARGIIAEERKKSAIEVEEATTGAVAADPEPAQARS